MYRLVFKDFDNHFILRHKRRFSITTTIFVTLFKVNTKVTNMFSENHTKSINILSEQIAEILRHFRKIAKKDY